MNKFILAENIKHILSEKYLLDERFILTEDVTHTNPSIVLTNTDITEISEKLSGPEYSNLNSWGKRLQKIAIPVEAKQLKTLKDIAGKEVMAAAQLSDVKAKVKSYLTTFLSLIDANKTTAENKLKAYPDIFNEYERLRDISTDNERTLTNEPEFSAGKDAPALRNLLAAFNKKVVAVGGVLRPKPDWYIAFEKAWKAANPVLTAIVQNTNQLANIFKNTEDQDLLSALNGKNLASIVQNINDQLPAGDALIKQADEANGKILTGYLQKIAKIDTEAYIQATKTLIDTLSKIQQANTDNTSSEKAANKIGPRIDWRTRLLNAQQGKSQETDDAVWQDYYQTEWKTDATLVKSLGSTFASTLINLGFTSQQNPWVAFINNCLARHIPLTRTSFENIMTAYGSNLFSESTLKGTDVISSNPTANLVYCKDLYNKSTEAVMSYFRLFNQLASLYTNWSTCKKAFANETLKDTFSGDTKKAKCLIISLFDNSKSPLIANQRATTSDSITDSTLKNPDIIAQELAMTIPGAEDSTEEKPTISNADIQNIVKGKSQQEMEKILAYYTTTYQKEVNISLYSIAKDYMPTTAVIYPNEASTYARLFSGVTIPADKIVNTLKELLKAAKAEKIKGFDKVPY